MTKKYTLLIAFLLFCCTTGIYAQQHTKTEIFDADAALFNGKLKRFFTYDAFQAVFGKADSVHLLMDLQPCSYIFEEEDGSKHADDAYLYKNGSRSEKSQDKVAVDEFRLTNANFIQYGDRQLSEKTTFAELKAMFPFAASQAELLNVEGEGELLLIHLAEAPYGQSDGAVRLYLKDGYLYYIHWWFPC